MVEVGRPAAPVRDRYGIKQRIAMARPAEEIITARQMADWMPLAGGQPGRLPIRQPGSPDYSRLTEESTGNVSYRIEWNQELCRECPCAQKCIGKNQGHRTLTVREFHMHLQRRRNEMGTKEFKEEMHRRNGIEGTQSELVRGYGMRKARYRGLAHLRMQNYFIGTACNVKRLARRMTWEQKEAGKIS